eukprot:g2058.t1
MTRYNVLLIASMLAMASAKTLTLKQWSGHGCQGEPNTETEHDVSEGCTQTSILSSYESTCDDYTFKLTLEYFYGSTTCNRICSGGLCYSKDTFYTGVCIDQTFEGIGGIEILSSYEANFDCYSESSAMSICAGDFNAVRCPSCAEIELMTNIGRFEDATAGARLTTWDPQNNAFTMDEADEGTSQLDYIFVGHAKCDNRDLTKREARNMKGWEHVASNVEDVSPADNDDVVAKNDEAGKGEKSEAADFRVFCAMRRLHIGSIKCMATSPPEPRNRAPILVTGGSDEYIRIFNLNKRRQVGTIEQQSGTITSLKFFVDPEKAWWLLSASEDKTICLWRVADWVCAATLKGHTGAVEDVSAHPSGRLCMSCSRDMTLRLWDLTRSNDSKRCASVMKVKEMVLSVSFSPSGDFIALTTTHAVTVHRIADFSVACELVHEYRVQSMGFIDNSRIVTAGEDHVLRMWNTEKGSEVKSVQTGAKSRIRAIDVSWSEEANDACAQKIWTTSSDGYVQVWDAATLTLEGVVDKGSPGTHHTCIAGRLATKIASKKKRVKKKKKNESTPVVATGNRKRSDRSGEDTTAKKQKRSDAAESKKKKKKSKKKKKNGGQKGKTASN